MRCAVTRSSAGSRIKDGEGWRRVHRLRSRGRRTADPCGLERSFRPCCALRAALHSPGVKPFRHTGLRMLFESGSAAGVQPMHAKRLRMQLAALDTALRVDDVDLPGRQLHPLRGEMTGRWSISVNGNWRVTFEFVTGTRTSWTTRTTTDGRAEAHVRAAAPR